MIAVELDLLFFVGTSFDSQGVIRPCFIVVAEEDSVAIEYLEDSMGDVADVCSIG